MTQFIFAAFLERCDVDGEFDPYYKWLAIPQAEQPPNHYRLLGVPLFTDDPDVIDNLAEQRIRHVRTFQSGANAVLAAQVLNEISAARVCLLHPDRKSQYDAQLRSIDVLREIGSNESRMERNVPVTSERIDVSGAASIRVKSPNRRATPGRWIALMFGSLLCCVLGYLLLIVVRDDVNQDRRRALVERGDLELGNSIDAPADIKASLTESDDNQSTPGHPPDLQSQAALGAVDPTGADEREAVTDPINVSGPTLTTDIRVPKLADLPAARSPFDGRRGTRKLALLSHFGATDDTLEAVDRGLSWLKKNQRQDGSWSLLGPYSDGAKKENAAAATAMTLLVFLGDGHTHREGDYTDEVDKGIRFLLANQDSEGAFAGTKLENERMYAHAQATMAICELHGMTGDESLRSAAQRAIDFAVKSQSAKGGWRYKPRIDADTSVTGWFVAALDIARAVRLEVDETVLENVSAYLDSAARDQGASYRYQPGHKKSSHSMTATGLLCRQRLGWHDQPVLKRGVNRLLSEAPIKMFQRDVYYWYHAAQVFHRFGGEPWTTWNERMRVALPSAQIKVGSEVGSWSPDLDHWGKTHGRLYSTCLTMLCLETYYRYVLVGSGDQLPSGG